MILALFDMPRAFELMLLLGILAFILVGIVGFFFLFIKIVKRTALRDAEDAIVPLRDKVLKLFERAESMKARHERLTGIGAKDVPPPAGATRRAYEEAGAKIQAFWEGWTELQQRLDKARLLVDAESKWGRTKLDEARELAQQKENVSTRADTLAREAESILERLEEAPTRAIAAAERARAAMAEGRARLADVERSGLPSAPYREKIAAFEKQLAEIESGLRSDPLGTSVAAEALAKQVEDLAATPVRALETRTSLARAAGEAELTSKEIAAARAEGLLPEGQGDPDDPERALDAARDAIGRGRAALEAGRPDDAARAADQAVSTLGAARARLEETRHAKADHQNQVDARRREQERLVGLLDQATSTQAALQEEHVEDAWRTVGAGLARARQLVSAIPERIAEAERLAAGGKQGSRPRWLASMRALLAAGKEQSEVAGLADAVEKRKLELETIARRARESLDRAERQVRALEMSLGEKGDDVLPRSRAAIDAAKRAVQAAKPGAASGPRDWPAQLGHAERALALVLEAEAAVQSDVAGAATLRAKRESAKKRLEEAKRYLEGRSEDRAAANERLSRAEREWAAAEAAHQKRDQDWGALGGLYAEVGALADKALAMAQGDVRLAEEATREIAEGEQAIAAANRYYGHGAAPDLEAARRLLSEAAQAMGRRDYEAAIRLGDDAEKSAKEAARAAELKSRSVDADLDRRRWAEEEQRRRSSGGQVRS